MQNVTTLNSDCQLLNEPMNLKPRPATPAKLEVFEETKPFESCHDYQRHQIEKNKGCPARYFKDRQL